MPKKTSVENTTVCEKGGNLITQEKITPNMEKKPTPSLRTERKPIVELKEKNKRKQIPHFAPDGKKKKRH